METLNQKPPVQCQECGKRFVSAAQAGEAWLYDCPTSRGFRLFLCLACKNGLKAEYRNRAIEYVWDQIRHLWIQTKLPGKSRKKYLKRVYFKI